MLKRPLAFLNNKDTDSSFDTINGKRLQSFDKKENVTDLKLQERLEGDFKVIKDFIYSEISDTSQAETIFHKIIHEIVKVRRLEEESREKIYWRDMYYNLQDIFEVDSSNYEWHDAMADIAMLLDGTSTLYSSTREANQCAEEVYNILLGYQGQLE